MSKADQRQEDIKTKETGEETGGKIREEVMVTKHVVVLIERMRNDSILHILGR